MKTFTTSVIINAPIEEVFKTISTPETFKESVPHILSVEFLSEQHSGIGTRFKETRMMGKREASTVLEISELVTNSSIRMVSKAGGSTWDSEFTVSEEPEGIRLQLEMKAIPHNLFARMMNSMIAKMLNKAIAEDLEHVKAYCEK